jgi:O-antigen/teichoic acid export membrane protein
MTVAISGPSAREVDWRFLRSLIWAGAPIGALYVTYNLYNYIDTVMISALRNQTETGWYGASFRVYEGLRLIPDVIATVLLPRLSRAYADTTSGFNQLVSAAYRYLFILALLVAGVGLLFSADLTNLIFGPDYTPAAVALSILLVGVPFVYIGHLLRMVLIAMDGQRLLLRVALFGLAVNVAANAIVIPRFGYLGAAVTTVAVEAVVFGVLSFIVFRKGALSGVLGKLMAAAGCGLGAGALAIGPLASSPNYLRAAVLATTFVGLLWLSGVIKSSDWTALRGRE